MSRLTGQVILQRAEFLLAWGLFPGMMIPPATIQFTDPVSWIDRASSWFRFTFPFIAFRERGGWEGSTLLSFILFESNGRWAGIVGAFPCRENR